MPDGIVVLGGAISSRPSRAHGEPVFDGDAGRITALVKLARAYPGARIVYSGGDASLLSSEAPEADFIYPLLDSFGIPRERVLLETRSRNTAENAIFTKELVKPKPTERWLLVTSARQMPRAVGCFRKAGFQVEAYPVGWRTTQQFDSFGERTMSDGLKRLDSAAYEWITNHCTFPGTLMRVRQQSAIPCLPTKYVIDCADDDARFLAGQFVVDRLSVAARRYQTIGAKPRELL